MKFYAPLLSVLVLFCAAFAPAAEEPWTEDDFTEVSGPASPHVAYGLRQNANGVSLLVDVAPAETGAVGRVDVGISAGKAIVLNSSQAQVLRNGDITRYAFVIPASALVTLPADWDRMRLAFAVSWPGGPFGMDRQRERFLHCDGGAPSAPLSTSPADWQPLDLKERAASVASLKKRIFINFDQPLEGKASIVIEDAQGRRVRNLVSGQPMPKGPQRIEWDGLDEQGNIVPTGAYRWRAVSHAGITPEYLFSFYNQGKPPWRSGAPSSNWLSDHTNAVATTAFEDRVYLGAPISESGHAIVQLDLAGEKTGHIDFPTLVGVGKLFMVADADGVYAIMEGCPAYEPFEDLPGGKWTYRRPLNVLRWKTDGTPRPYDGPRGEKVITLNLYNGSGPHGKSGWGLPQPDNLAGAAFYKGRIFISLKQEDRIVVISTPDGKIVGETKLKDPGLIASDGKGLIIAFSGDTLMRIDPNTFNATPLFIPLLSDLPVIGDPEEPFYGFNGVNPTGMALGSGSGGEIYLSDNGTDQNVKVYDLKGRLLRQIGKKGGRPMNGLWDTKGMARPHGLSIDRDNKLWVVETNTFPRRHSVWNAKTGELIRDFTGPCFYGADMGAFDTADHTRWIGGGALWKLDFDQKTATPTSTLYHQTKTGQMQTGMMGHYWNFEHRNGRTFLIGYGMGQSVYELRADGTLKLWAFCGNLASIAQAPRWTLPKVITELPAVKALFAENAKKNRNPPLDMKTEPHGLWLDKVSLNEGLLKDVSVLYVDRNGDDVGQPDEFEVLPSGDSMMTGGWGTGSPTIDMNIPAKIGDKPVILHLKPDGFLPSGAPNYSLAKAVAAAVLIEEGLVGSESIQDRFGREIFNSSPMKAVGPDGRTLWSFPNKWVNVHGSHEAPLPQIGVMQGALYFLGTAPLDEKSEVFIMNGNHGRFFVLTTDGIYLDEMFKDVRVTQNSDAYMIGGECFGGYFGKAENGKYYLQSGHTDYRIFEIKGFDQLKRSQGNLDVSAAQALAAQANREARIMQEQKPKTITISDIPPFTNFSTDPGQWPGQWLISWGDAHQPYPFVQVKAFRSAERLYLAYSVKDPSPWVNKGKDWTMLFKTGDSVDFQFSTDPNAKAGRPAAAPGDRRLLIAPFGDRSIAVLYSYREPGAAAPMSFSSPSRTEIVDRVTELKSAKIDVKIGEGQAVGTYTITVSVPLADLGLPATGKVADLLGDFGVIYGDADGSMNLLRSYWSNQATGLVNDVPGEIMITPRLWGTLRFNPTPTP